MVSPIKPGMIEEGGSILMLEDCGGSFLGPWQHIPIHLQPFWQRMQKGAVGKAGGSYVPPFFCLEKIVRTSTMVEADLLSSVMRSEGGSSLNLMSKEGNLWN